MSINFHDLAVRAFHTWWQSFAAAVAVVFAASGANVSQINDIESAKKVGLAFALAIVAAALSALKTTVKTLTADSSGIFETDDPDPDDILPAPVAGPVTATQAKAATPEPVAEPAAADPAPVPPAAS